MVALGAIVTALVASPSAFAAPPRNDNFSNAQSVGLGSLTIGTTVDATIERGEPVVGFNGGTVWYRLRAPRTGEISVNTCGTRFDLTLGAFRGRDVKSLTELAEDDDAGCPQRGGYFGSHIRFDARRGTTYRLSVGAFAPPGGRFQLVTSAVARFANDAFSRARSIGVGRRAIQNNDLATAESREPRHAGRRASHSLWFKFRAPATGRFQLSTEASSFDTLLAVYRGSSLSSSRRVASNDDANARTVSSRVRFRATRGTVYRIALDGFETANAAGTGDAVLTLTR